jgi:hypothetical protein
MSTSSSVSLATSYGRRIAHGVLLVGYMSGAACKFVEATQASRSVSYGWDRTRFVKTVCIAVTISFEYKITDKIPEKSQARAQVTATNQSGGVVAGPPISPIILEPEASMLCSHGSVRRAAIGKSERIDPRPTRPARRSVPS